MKAFEKMIRRIGRIRLIGPIALALPLLATGAFAGEQPAKLGGAFAVAAPAENQPQYYPRAAWSNGAKCWLVVWQDGAPTDDGTDGEGPAQNVLAARVGADGKVLDAKPIGVCTAKGSQLRPMVASDGNGFLVVWHDFRNKKDWDVYGARVAGEGKVLDPDGVLLSGGEHNQCFPDVVWATGNYYVAWLDMRHWPEYRVYGSRVSPECKPLDAGGVELIRVMSDKEMDAWKKAPFAPGKLGKGWHNFGVKGVAGVRQPGPPSLGANGKTVVVSTGINEEGPCGEYLVRAIDPASGKPGAQGESDLPTKIEMSTPNYYVRQCHAAVGDKGFLTANSIYCAGFGAGGQAFWLATFLDSAGAPVGGKSAKFERILLDEKQSVPPGYRTYGLRTTTIDLAWDGKRALYVAEHHQNSGPSKSGPGTPGDIDIWGIFVSAEGKRLADPSGTQTVEADTIKNAGPVVDLPEGTKVEPVKIGTGLATQAAPAACGGPEGTFLVLWQEEEPGKDSRIMARTVGVK